MVEEAAPQFKRRIFADLKEVSHESVLLQCLQLMTKPLKQTDPTLSECRTVAP